MGVSTENKLLRQQKNAVLHSDALKNPFLEAYSVNNRSSIQGSSTKNVLLEKLSQNLSSSNLFSANLENKLLKEKDRLTSSNSGMGLSTENTILDNYTRQDLGKPTLSKQSLVNPLLQEGTNLTSKTSMQNRFLNTKSDLKFHTRNTLLAPTFNLGQTHKSSSSADAKNVQDFDNKVESITASIDNEMKKIKSLSLKDYKDMVPYSGEMKFPSIDEVRQNCVGPISPVTISKTSLIETVFTSLINNPVWFKETDATRMKLHKLCSEISTTEPEFVLKVALYTRKELNIRATSNFLLALSALIPTCRPYLKKYYTMSIILPSDWIQVAEFYQSLSNPDGAKESSALPSALRKVMVTKFPAFDEYQLGKYNKTKAKSSKKKKAKIVEKKKPNEGDTDEIKDDEPKLKLYVPSFTLKFLIRKLHIMKPAQPVMKILGKKYPNSVEAFYKCGLEGTWDNAMAGKRMKLEVPETWETQVSAKGNIAKTWEDLLDHRKLPFMAMLRNLRNMIKAGISEKHHVKVLKTLTNERAVTKSRQFPFRFFSAYEVLTVLNDEIENQSNYKQYGVAHFVKRNMKKFLKRKFGDDTPKTEDEKKIDVLKKVLYKKYDKPLAYDDEIIARYKKALDTAVKIATTNNVPPIAGHTVVMCDIREDIMQKLSNAKGLGPSRTLVEVGVLLGLMCMYSCEACTFLISNGEKYKVIEIENGGILTNLERIIKLVNCHQSSQDQTTFLPTLFLEESLINRIKMDSLLILSTKMEKAENDTLNMFLERYKDVVNSGLMCYKVDLAGKRPSLTSEGTVRNVLEFSGYSEQILKFVALGCAEAQLNSVATIDKRYNLVSDESTNVTIEKRTPVVYTAPLPKPWRTVRVFISSTIKDLMNERDSLVQNVFPILRERAKKMGIHVIETDLRWGITGEDSRYDRSVGICLQEVKKSDIFIAILGERYGWVPSDYGFPEKGSEWLEDYPDGRSITELEIAQAAFIDGSKKDCYFYFRECKDFNKVGNLPKSLKNTFFEKNSQKQLKLKELKRAIVKNDFAPKTYQPELEGVENGVVNLNKLDSFEESVLEDLTNALDKLSSDDSKLQSKNTDQTVAQDDLLSAQSFVGRSFLLSSTMTKIVNVKKNSGGNIIALTGKHGSGKSALLSAAYKNILSTLHNGVACIHFPKSFVDDIKSPLRAIRCFCSKIADAHDIHGLYMQNDLESMLGVYQSLLRRLKDFYVTMPRLLLFVDDIDTLGTNVEWLSRLLHEGVTLVVSCLEQGPVHKALKHITGVVFHSITDLTMSDKREIVRSVLGKHSKKLDESHFNNQMQVLLSKQGSNNPLYISNVCEMIRTQESFESLSKTLKGLPHDLEGIIKWQLKVAETRFKNYPQLIAIILGLVYCSSKWNISEEDLYQALCLLYCRPKTLPRAAMHAALRAVKPFLVFHERAEGTLLSFCHTIHEKLVEEIYMSNDQFVRYCHSILASLYTSRLREDTTIAKDNAGIAVSLTRLPTHLALSGQKEVLQKLLTDFHFIIMKCRLGFGKQLVNDYILLEGEKVKKYAIKKSARKSIKPWKEMSAFVKSCVHVISHCPEMLYQIALNYPKDSYPFIASSKMLSSTNENKSNIFFIEQGTQAESELSAVQTYGEEIVNDTRICIATHPKSEYIAWGSVTGKVGVFQKNSGNETNVWSGHSCEVSTLCFINKAILLSASTDGKVSVWNIAEGYKVQTFSAHSGKVSGISVQPLRQGSAGRIFATASHDQSIAFWNVSNLKFVNRIQTNGSCVNCIDFHPNEPRVVTGLWDSSIRIWDARTSKRVAVIRGHLQAVSSVQYSLCGTYIASCSEFESVIRLWAAGAGIPLGNFGETYLTSVKSLTFSHNGEYLIGAGEGTNESVSKLAVWKSHLGNKEATYWVPNTEEYGNATCCRLNKDKTKLVGGFHEGYISLYDPLLPNSLFTKKIHDSAVSCIAWVPGSDVDGIGILFANKIPEILITGSTDCTLKALDPSTGSIIAVFEGHTAPILTVDCCKNWVASGSEDFNILLWRTENVVQTIDIGEQNCNSNVDAMEKKTTCMVKHSIVLRSHEGPVSCLAFNPDSTLLVSGGRDGKIAYWDISTLDKANQNQSNMQQQQQQQQQEAKRDIKPIAVIDQAHMDWITCCSWNDTSDHIVTGSNDSTLKVWCSPETPITNEFRMSPLYILKGHKSGITSVVYRFGCIVSTGGEDHTIRIWSHRGVEITSLKTESRTNSCDVTLHVNDDDDSDDDDSSIVSLEDLEEEQNLNWADEVDKEEWNEEHEKRKPGAKKKLNAEGSTDMQNFGVVCASNNAEISLWKPLVGKNITTMSEQAESVNHVLVSGENEIASCSSNGKIKLWNLTSTSDDLRHNGEVTAIIRFNNVIVSSCDAGYLYLWDFSPETDKLRMMYKAKAHTKRITAMCRLKEMKFATISHDMNLIFWTVGVIQDNKKEELQQFSLQKKCTLPLKCPLVSLSACLNKNQITLWVGDVREQIVTMEVGDDCSSASLLEPRSNTENQRYSVICGDNSTDTIWISDKGYALSDKKHIELDAGEFLHSFAKEIGPEKGLLAGSSEGYLYIRNKNIKKKIHNGRVTVLLDSTKFLVTGAHDSTVKIWAKPSLNQIGQFLGSSPVTTACMFSEEYIIFGDSSGMINTLKLHCVSL